jgi:hypothetical protein
MYQTNNPVLFIIFNRPEQTKKIFEILRIVKPKRLYIAADAPRENREGEVQKWFAGHSTWVYPFFASGIIFGSVLPIVLLSSLVNGYRAAVSSFKYSSSTGPAIAFTVMLAYIGQSFTANLFASRYAGLVLGIVVASIFLYGRNDVQVKLKMRDSTVNVEQEQTKNEELRCVFRSR